MSQIYETIKQSEMLGLSFLITAAMVLCIAIIFFFALLILSDKKYIPVIRPIKETDVIKKYLSDMKNNFFAYHNSIMTLDEGKDLKNAQGIQDVALIVLKNYGNCPAIDIQVKKLGGYIVEEDYANRFVSLLPGETASFLIYAPKDLLATISVSEVVIKYKNFANKPGKSRFSVISEPDMSYEVTEKHIVYPFVLT